MSKKTIIVIFAMFLIGYNLGAYFTQKEYNKRASEKDTFTNQDIEHILYNTPLNN